MGLQGQGNSLQLSPSMWVALVPRYRSPDRSSDSSSPLSGLVGFEQNPPAALLNPEPSGDECVEEDGRDWRDYGAHWVQNNKTDGYSSVASRFAATAVWDTEAVISWGGDVEKCDIEVNLGCGATCASQIRVERIQAAVDDSHDAAIFTDGSRGEDGRTAGGWSKDTFEAGPRDGGKYLGEGETVWDGEVAGMAEALEKGPRDRGVLILADSVAAIRAVKKAGRTGKARTEELARVLREVQRRQLGGGSGVRFAWVKAHVGIPGNERADQQAKFHTRVVGLGVLTEGGIKQQLTARRKTERVQVGWGGGRVARWGRRAATRYTHCRTGKGNLRGWLREIGKGSADGVVRHMRMGSMSSSSARSCGGLRQRRAKSGRRGRTLSTRDGLSRLKGRGVRRVRRRSWILLKISSAGSEIQRRMRKRWRWWPRAESAGFVFSFRSFLLVSYVIRSSLLCLSFLSVFSFSLSGLPLGLSSG